MALKGLSERFGKRSAWKILYGLSIFLGLLIGLEIGLNFWIRSALERAFLGEGQRVSGASAIEPGMTQASINWIGLADMLSGKVRWVRIHARYRPVGPLEYTLLNIDNQGFTIHWPALVRDKRLMISNIQRTRVRAVLETASLQKYLSTYYPQFRPQIQISPNRIQFSGVAVVFGSTVPIRLEGDLRLSGPKGLQFFPMTLTVAGRPVSGSLLRFVSDQVPLQFGVLENWPLQITGFALKNGYITLDLQEDDLSQKRVLVTLSAGNGRIPPRQTLSGEDTNFLPKKRVRAPAGELLFR